MNYTKYLILISVMLFSVACKTHQSYNYKDYILYNTSMYLDYSAEKRKNLYNKKAPNILGISVPFLALLVDIDPQNISKQDKDKISFYLTFIEDIYKNKYIYRNGKLVYNFSYKPKNENEAEYFWSAMALSTMLFAQTLYDKKFNTDKFKEHREEIIKTLLTDYKKGGTLVSFPNKSTWELEYVWNNIKNKMYVFNGNTFATLHIGNIYLITKDPRLKKLYFSQIKGIKERNDKYLMKVSDWSYYGKEIITSPHYALFDIYLLQQLNKQISLNKFKPYALKTIGEELFSKEISERIRRFKEAYPIEIHKLENGEGVTFLHSAIGPPHEYWVDIYKVTIKDHHHHIWANDSGSHKKEEDVDKRLFIIDTLTNEEYEKISKLSIVHGPNSRKMIKYDIYKYVISFTTLFR